MDPELPGCSGHIHQSLWDGGGKKNVFFDAKAEHGLSPTFRSYIAGQLACLPELLPLYAPTVNSYKRLVEGAWAPTRANWGVDNRTTALRAIPGGPKSSSRGDARERVRLQSLPRARRGASQRHLGVENKLSPPPATTGSGYDDKLARVLPRTLEEATDRLEQSSVARELFGTRSSTTSSPAGVGSGVSFVALSPTGSSSATSKSSNSAWGVESEEMWPFINTISRPKSTLALARSGSCPGRCARLRASGR